MGRVHETMCKEEDRVSNNQVHLGVSQEHITVLAYCVRSRWQVLKLLSNFFGDLNIIQGIFQRWHKASWEWEPLSACKGDKALSRICSTEKQVKGSNLEMRKVTQHWKESDISRRATKFVFESSKASPRAVASPSIASPSSVALTAFKLRYWASTALSWDNQRVSVASFSFNLGSFNTCCISQSSAAWVVLLEKV